MQSVQIADVGAIKEASYDATVKRTGLTGPRYQNLCSRVVLHFGRSDPDSFVPIVLQLRALQFRYVCYLRRFYLTVLVCDDDCGTIYLECTVATAARFFQGCHKRDKA